MKLIPEQIQRMQEKIEDLKSTIEGYNAFFEDVRRSNGDRNEIYIEADNATRTQCYLNEKTLQEYEEALKNAERIRHIDVTKINLGTKFTLQFTGEEEIEEYTLVENRIGAMDSKYMSTDSIIGKTIRGMMEGDTFTYEINLDKNGTSKISGTILGIVTDREEYVNYITSRKKSHRISRASKKESHENPSVKSVLTKSQYELLEEESQNLLTRIQQEEFKKQKIAIGTKVEIKYKGKEPKFYTIIDKPENKIDPETEISWESSLIGKLMTTPINETFNYQKKSNETGKVIRKSGTVQKIDNSLIPEEETFQSLSSCKRRLAVVKNLLETSTLANPSTDLENNVIGIGSHVSIMIFSNGEVKNTRVEIIKQAVSNELETNYIEAISPLGNQLIGLTNNEGFISRKGAQHITGIVYDIDNSKNAIRTTNPLAYQKSKSKA